MTNHLHVVVEVSGDPDPGKVLADFKAYGTRALSRVYGRPQSETWWTEKGSTRKLKDYQAVSATTTYVLHKQPHPLVVWPSPDANPSPPVAYAPGSPGGCETANDLESR